jgi:hypothetical protein
MGQTLSEPVTNKETAICQDEYYKVINIVSADSSEIKLKTTNCVFAIIIHNPPAFPAHLKNLNRFVCLLLGRQQLYARMENKHGRQPHAHSLTSR